MKKLFAGAILTAAAVLPFGGAAHGANDFLAKAIQGDNSEIMLGQLAEKSAGSARVRQFGAMLVADHTKAKTQASALASEMNLTPPTDPTPEARSEYEKLSKMNGKDFDAEFVQYMAADHKKDIGDFTQEASANDGQASALAKKQLPTLKKHLRAVQSLQSKS